MDELRGIGNQQPEYLRQQRDRLANLLIIDPNSCINIEGGPRFAPNHISAPMIIYGMPLAESVRASLTRARSREVMGDPSDEKELAALCPSPLGQ